jgi:uncharacterized protein (DUF1800 family)
MLRPFEATSDEPWNWERAAHLLNRAGFGGTAEEIQLAVDEGMEKTVDRLLDFPDAPADEQSETDIPDLSEVEGYARNYRDLVKMMAGKNEEERRMLRQELMRKNREAVAATVAWWLNRMTEGPYPLQEKLTLLWHGHFTTSARDERSAWLMWRQNELLRRNAAGNFHEYVRQISRDPAMLDYLNNQQNRKAKPNENYARELMELFTLGIGNYTEQDIKEAARAFTGWAHDGDDFIYRKFDHDNEKKTFMGRTGNFDGDDVIRIIFEHPQMPRYITSKMWGWFAYDNPEKEVVEGLAQVFKDERWELRPVLRTILTSKAFYDKKAIGSQIKSPVQLVVGTTRMLGVEMPRARSIVGGGLRQMGQVPMEPPNVKGWPGGRLWISTSTLFVRYNTAMYLAGGASLPEYKNTKPGKASTKVKGSAPKVGFEPKGGGSPAEVVDEWVARLIQRPIAGEKRKVLLEALGDKVDEKSVKKLVQLIVSTPDYQLC